MSKKDLSFDEIMEKSCNNPITVFAMMLSFVLYIPIGLIVHIIQFLCLIIKYSFSLCDCKGDDDNDKNDN